MYDDVLIPTDGSDVASDTMEHGLAIAADHDAIIHALYVIDNRLVMAADRSDRDAVRDNLEREGEAAIERIVDAATERGLEARSALRSGTPDREIINYSAENGIDLIAIGSHGKSPREKVQSLGSVSERVVDSATVPVFVVKNVQS